MTRFTKRSALLAVVAVAALAAAIGGYAYFTSTGTGAGTAAVGSSSGDVSVTGTAAGSLYPGGVGVVVSFTATNPAAFQQKIGTIHLSSVDAPTNCDASAFTMPDVTVGADGTLAGSATDVALSETGTLSMADSASSQDACQGASLTLHFTTS